VTAAPLLVLTIGETLRFPNYRATDGDPVAAFALVFLCWSAFTSYAAVQQRFVVRPAAARWWFFVFPLLWYVVASVGFGVLLYFADNAAD
jgi:hypothetical protein